MEMFLTLAKYNQWMNNSVYAKCIDLGQENIEKDQDAFFGSILRTLNHLMIGDLFWLARCTQDASLMKPKDVEGNTIKLTGLDTILYRDIEELFSNRQQLDQKILNYVKSLDESQLSCDISYRNSRGEELSNPLNEIMLHWFNHQTHHRGQITTMLTQQGVDIGVTDLIYIKDEF